MAAPSDALGTGIGSRGPGRGPDADPTPGGSLADFSPTRARARGRRRRPGSDPPMPPSALRFGPFVLDLERLCLRGPDGEVELRPKSFEVLRRPAERPRRVVPKEALIGAVWPDVTVTDDSLTR